MEQVVKLAKKGLTPSQIGVILRDSHGIAQVAHVTGSKILRMLKKQGADRTPRTLAALSASDTTAVDVCRALLVFTRACGDAWCAQGSRLRSRRISTA